MASLVWWALDLFKEKTVQQLIRWLRRQRAQRNWKKTICIEASMRLRRSWVRGTKRIAKTIITRHYFRYPITPFMRPKLFAILVWYHAFIIFYLWNAEYTLSQLKWSQNSYHFTYNITQQNMYHFNHINHCLFNVNYKFQQNIQLSFWYIEV